MPPLFISNMTRDEIILLVILSVFVLAVSLSILYGIISSATRSKKILLNAEMQTRLLSSIAKNQGVSEEVIDKILLNTEALINA